MAEQATIRRHWWVAALLGIFVGMGAGQIYNGRPTRVLILLGGFVVLLALFHTSIPSAFAGFAVLYSGLLILPVAGAIEAALSARRHPTIVRRAFHRWYVYLAYGLAMYLSLYAMLSATEATAIGEPTMFGSYRPFRASASSSEPNLMRGDYFMVQTSRGATRDDLLGKIGSLVVVSWPGVEGTYVYRLVAVGGQKIAVRDGAVFVDGKRQPQRELCTTTDAETGRSASRWAEALAGNEHVVQYIEGFDLFRNSSEEIVPAGQFFVLGDSRDNANDSRSRGPVADEAYAGQALYVFWSKDWSRIGRSLSPRAPVQKAAVCPESAK